MLVLTECILQFKQIEILDSIKPTNFFIQLLLWLKIGVLSILEMLLVLPAANFFAHHMTNLMKATEGMYVIAAFSISAIMYVLFLFKKQNLIEILHDLQSIVNKSELI